MPYNTVQVILDECRASYLNDPSKNQFSDVNLLAALKTAYNFMQNRMEKADLSIKLKTFIKKVTALTDTSLAGLPGDFVWPINLEERDYGSSDNFSPMIQVMLEPVGVRQGTTLVYWSWRDLDQIRFIGSTTDREVKLTYLSLFPQINGVQDNVFGNSMEYLKAKIGAIVHLFISQNTTLAEQCDIIAVKELDSLMMNYIKRNQGVPSSPIPFINTGW